MTGIVDITKDALQIITDKTIVSLDENSNAARQAKIAYPKARDFVLREYPWICATRRVLLPSSAETAAYGDWIRYRRPADDVRLLPVTLNGEADGTPAKYRLEGRFILTVVEAPLKYRYVTNNLDPVEMPPDLRHAIAAQMAVRLAEILTGSQTILSEALGRYRLALADAKRSDSDECDLLELAENSWNAARD